MSLTKSTTWGKGRQPSCSSMSASVPPLASSVINQTCFGVSYHSRNIRTWAWSRSCTKRTLRSAVKKQLVKVDFYLEVGVCKTSSPSYLTPLARSLVLSYLWMAKNSTVPLLRPLYTALVCSSDRISPHNK